MKRMLPYVAAALLGTTVSASAARVAEISLDGYCNIYHIKLVGLVASAQDTPSCSGTYGGGFVVTMRTYGRSLDLALQNASSPGVQLVLMLSYPFVNGGTFELYQTTDGTTFTDALDGTYSIDTAPDRGTKSERSVTAGLKR